MWEFILKYWLEVIFAAVVGLLSIGYQRLSKKLKKSREDQEAVKNGIRVLLRDRIIQAYNCYTEKGYIPIYALENVEAMYQEYHSLGGNGTITGLVEELRRLPKP